MPSFDSTSRSTWPKLLRHQVVSAAEVDELLLSHLLSSTLGPGSGCPEVSEAQARAALGEQPGPERHSSERQERVERDLRGIDRPEERREPLVGVAKFHDLSAEKHGREEHPAGKQRERADDLQQQEAAGGRRCPATSPASAAQG